MLDNTKDPGSLGLTSRSNQDSMRARDSRVHPPESQMGKKRPNEPGYPGKGARDLAVGNSPLLRPIEVEGALPNQEPEGSNASGSGGESHKEATKNRIDVASESYNTFDNLDTHFDIEAAKKSSIESKGSSDRRRNFGNADQVNPTSNQEHKPKYQNQTSLELLSEFKEKTPTLAAQAYMPLNLFEFKPQQFDDPTTEETASPAKSLRRSHRTLSKGGSGTRKMEREEYKMRKVSLSKSDTLIDSNLVKNLSEVKIKLELDSDLTNETAQLVHSETEIDNEALDHMRRVKRTSLVVADSPQRLLSPELSPERSLLREKNESGHIDPQKQYEVVENISYIQQKNDLRSKVIVNVWKKYCEGQEWKTQVRVRSGGQSLEGRKSPPKESAGVTRIKLVLPQRDLFELAMESEKSGNGLERVEKRLKKWVEFSRHLILKKRKIDRQTQVD